MVYYIKAMAKGAAKLALPIAFAASAFTPAMAEIGITGNTTLKLKAFDKIAYDETKEVAIVLTAKAEDKLSMVEFSVTIPEGMEYVPGSFKKKVVDQLKNHTFKMEPNSEGFHVGIYNDDMKTLGTLNEDTIATFQVKANTKLTGKDDLLVTIDDLTDSLGNQLNYKNEGAFGIEGEEGDNSIGAYEVEIDENTMPGQWNVYVTADNLNATRDTMTIDPTKVVYTKQNVQVNLRNEDAKISGIQFHLMLPEGMSLVEGTVEANSVRTKEKSSNYKVITDENGDTNDYVIFIEGDNNAIDGNDGVLLSFQVQVDANNTMAAQDSIKLEGIHVSSIHAVTLPQDDIKIVVNNLNQAAKDRIDKAYKLVDDFANMVEDNENRVYDYETVLNARQAVLNTLDEHYKAGELHLNSYEADIMALIDAYEAAVEKAYKANNELYARYTKDIKDLKERLAELIPEGVNSVDAWNSRIIAGKMATEYTVKDLLDADVKAKYLAAKAAIGTFEDKVNKLWEVKDSVKARGASDEKFDGELLTDSIEVNGLKQAASDAIDAFEAQLKDANETTADDLTKLTDDGDNATNTDLAGILADAVKVVAELSPAHHTIDSTLLNKTNFPEIQEAIEAAQAAIDAVKPVIEAQKAAGLLPFEEGIQPVIDAIKAAKTVIDKLEPLAEKLMWNNDHAYDGHAEEIRHLQETLDGKTINDTLQNTKTFKDAVKAVQDAIDAFQDLLDEKDMEAMVDKSSIELDGAFMEVHEKLDSLDKVIKNLQDLNVKVDNVNDMYDKVEAALNKAIAENTYLEHGINTEDDIDKIKEALADVKHDVDSIAEKINSAEPWQEVTDQKNVNRWNVELDELLKKLLGEDGVLDDKGGIEGDIADAVEKYKKTHLRGDTDLDGEIDLADYVEALNYVLEKKSVYGTDELPAYNADKVKCDEKFDALDVSYNDKLNVGDAVAVANIVDHGDPGDLAAREMSDVKESLTVSEQTVDGLRTIALNLTNGRAYVAAQLDVVLPEGVKLAGMKLGSRNAGHDLMAAVTADGAQRIVIASKTNELFQGGEGTVLYLTVEGEGDLQFENVILADAGARDYEFAVGAAAETTGIAAVKAAAEGEQVYSIGGRLMNAVKKGINIIRRADGSVQKVIKK